MEENSAISITDLTKTASATTTLKLLMMKLLDVPRTFDANASMIPTVETVYMYKF